MPTVFDLEKVQVWQKVLATTDSRNFYVSLVSIVLFIFDFNQLGLNLTPEAIVDAILSGDSNALLLMLVNFINPILKIINNTAEWSWSFLRSWNFWIQVGTGVLFAATLYIGIEFPDNAVTEISEALQSGVIGTITLAFVVNILNPILHFIFDVGEDARNIKKLPSKPVAKSA